MSKIIGYIVMESCEDYELGLCLVVGDALPEGGVLDWRDKQPVTLFDKYSAAMAAINRTEHYRLAFASQRPEKKFCKPVPIKVS